MNGRLSRVVLQPSGLDLVCRVRVENRHRGVVGTHPLGRQRVHADRLDQRPRASDAVCPGEVLGVRITDLPTPDVPIGRRIDPSGLIATNEHVIDGATSIEVSSSDGTGLLGRLVAISAEHDLALVKMDVGRPLMTVAFRPQPQPNGRRHGCLMIFILTAN